MNYHPLYFLDHGALKGVDVPCLVRDIPIKALGAGTVWLCGGHPSIAAQAEAINASSIPRMTLNNTAKIIRADWALFLDHPEGYDQDLLTTGRTQVVIGRMNYEGAQVGGRKWCEQPNTWFVSDVGEEKGDWLNEGPLVWFKNSFCAAIQILYRMGFRQIILAGCKFGDAGQYAYGERPDLRDKNAKLYADQVEWLRRNMEYFKAQGLEILNATPGSAATFLKSMASPGMSGLGLEGPGVAG